MNFKSIGFALAATSVVAAGIVSAPSSAQAATFNANNLLEFSGRGTFANPEPLTFGRGFVTTQTGFFSSLTTTPDAGPVLGNAPVVDVATVSTVPFAGSLPNFLSFPNADPKFNFTLTSFVPTFSGGATRIFEFKGVFGDSAFVRTGEISITGGSAYSGAISVPTPALLPGLIGMGAAALRKKRKGEGFEATPEATEANA